MRPHRPENPPVPWPPHEVTTVCEMFLEDIDRAAPGLVEGLYLHGSLGFGEWYAGRSDIDYVAVLAEPPGRAATAALREVHVGLTTTFPRPAFDGFHVTWQDLGRPPGQCPDVPVTFAGEFGEQGRVDMNPVTWHELARHGAAVRGPAPERVDIWTDQGELRAYTHGNLRSYWARQVEQVARFPAEAAKPEIAAWFVLGLPRLHHLLATDRLTSKDGAGHHAVAAFGERWRPLVTEALAHRATGARAGVLSGGSWPARWWSSPAWCSLRGWRSSPEVSTGSTTGSGRLGGDEQLRSRPGPLRHDGVPLHGQERPEAARDLSRAVAELR